jgi:hypothetical protein
MRVGLSGLVTLIAFCLMLMPGQASSCESDNDCRSGRICEDGECRSPDRDRGLTEHHQRATHDEDDDDDREAPPKRLPHFCCTSFGKLGPYPNPDARTGTPVHVGGACYGTAPNGMPVGGTACY